MGPGLRLGAAFALAAALGAAPAAAGPWAPRGWMRQPPQHRSLSTSPAAVTLGWALHLYRSTVSRVDGDRCTSYPTCSAYAAEAVRTQGPWMGLLLTFGRLVAEADEAGFAPRIWVGGKWRVYDPVEQDLAFWRGSLAP
ncbi:membrane protein insertion efficiency factor YidD [Deferrisoma camini]|uniref:membrane protein insertion efficiency factor YidD n=1 Tax=Deferrisoma camini TaxID=1035120 RepID=UPI00046D1D0F|nr:membrane protein insertion efficiency factor YidD [Deferrisoma camini]